MNKEEKGTWRLDDTREKRMHYCTAVQYSNFGIA